MASARERKDAEDLLRRYPNDHEMLMDIPAVREIKHEQAAAWVKSLGLDPARHGLPTPKKR
jgi:hypothetical protein